MPLTRHIKEEQCARMHMPFREFVFIYQFDGKKRLHFMARQCLSVTALLLVFSAEFAA